ncbi:5'-methylthioadenosine nucleosidase [Alphaproteobacteria bacterium]|nr:5'-methylthioadenosine nucleosidase [Alphaproteobacteria bacterium]
MIYLLVALPAELPDTSRLGPDFTVIFNGVGKVNAAFHAMQAASQADCELIINYGTAGTLTASLAGQFLRVSKIFQRDMDGRPLAELGVTPFEEGALAGAIDLSCDGVTLSTGDNFVREASAVASDIVDMEAYAIAKICARLAIPFECYKFVTDLANENATANWRDNVALGAEQIIAHLTSSA